MISSKISKKLKGVPLSEETKRKLSISHIGKKQSEETKKKRYHARKHNGSEWHSADTKKKISDSNKIIWNSPEYIEKRKEMFSDEVRKKISNKLKDKIEKGEFTPCITNTWTKWDSFVIVNGHTKKFRSNWECVFWLLNKDLEYEKIRIPYIYRNKKHTYITDFADFENKVIYEIKPDSQKDNPKTEAKIKSAKEWCNENKWKFILISDTWFKENAKKVNYELHPQLKKPMSKFIWE